MKFPSIIVLSFLKVSLVQSHTLEFNLPSLDGKAQINGQIDYPKCGAKPFPAVLMVGGTGIFSRDVYFGKSGTERDFLFKDLSERANRQCIATLRFDYRGMKCRRFDKNNTIEKCLDQKVRASVTADSVSEDIQSVYNFAIEQSDIDPNKISFFGHSEGSLNISKLIAKNSIKTQRLIFMGGLTESPMGIIHYQIVERPADWAMEMDENEDGILHNDEIQKNFSKNPLSTLMLLKIENILSPKGTWTKAEITSEFEQTYLQVSGEALSHKDEEPYLSGGIIFTSYNWWKRWFLDDVSVIENLKDFVGRIEYHNGDIDSQTPGNRELDFLNNSNVEMKSKPKFHLYPGVGHGMNSSSPIHGPIEESIANKIVEGFYNF